MDYEIVYLEEKNVNGLIITTCNEEMKAMTDIGNLWQEFLPIHETIPNKINAKVIGLYSDYQGDYTKPYNFYACCEVEKDKNVIKTIPKGQYAKFIVKGDIKEVIGEFWGKLWGMNLPRKYSADFEEYQNNTDDISNQEVHIYISIE